MKWSNILGNWRNNRTIENQSLRLFHATATPSAPVADSLLRPGLLRQLRRSVSTPAKAG
jgi:hypothetical protein